MLVQTPILMTEDRFLGGLTWPDYLAQMKVNRERITQLFEEITLAPEERHAFAQAVARHGGRLGIAALVEDWCGDAVVVLPLIARLAAGVPGLDLRLFVRSANLDLAQAYAADDIGSIPVLSFFNTGWREVGRWVERPLAAVERINQWKAIHPEFEGLRQSDRPEDRKALRALLKERLIEMMDWYREGLWEVTLEELKSLL